jgi:hypothetical protein
MKSSYLTLFKEASNTYNDSALQKSRMIEYYATQNNISRAQSYRHYDKEKYLFNEEREGRIVYLSLKQNAESLHTDDIAVTREAILMEQDAEKLRAFVLEALMNHEDEYMVILKGAEKRVKKLHIEKKITLHERAIKELQKELKK